ncbi:nuclear transport factor 2 family protein [Mucilaginibacter sp.]|uniref:nuclear transport factor 2 family protein n=1 Tax=Mucilaginibacter sp. TaxID=1882438 RepID=UPI0035BC7DD5
MDQKEQIVTSYIDAYNKMDVEGMVFHLHPDIVFKNVSNGNVDMTLNGLTEFKQQATNALQVFTSRKQTITAVSHSDNSVTVDIHYKATLAVSLPNGLNPGDILEMTGKSIFKFEAAKIIELTDVS